jgi:hypothetical protein
MIFTVTVNGTVTNWRKKMKELQKILEGLDRINAKLEEILKIQKNYHKNEVVSGECGFCGSDVWNAPPKKTHREVLDG